MPPRQWVRSDSRISDAGAYYLVVLLTFSVTVAVALVVVTSLSYEVRTLEFRSLNFVNPVFALPEFS